jgi:hypothetical protein
MSSGPAKVLVLSGHQDASATARLVNCLRPHCEIVEAANIDQGIDELRRQHFTAIFSDADDFLPLERALVGQQASLILNTDRRGHLSRRRPRATVIG